MAAATAAAANAIARALWMMWWPTAKLVAIAGLWLLSLRVVLGATEALVEDAVRGALMTALPGMQRPEPLEASFDISWWSALADAASATLGLADQAPRAPLDVRSHIAEAGTHGVRRRPHQALQGWAWSRLESAAMAAIADMLSRRLQR